MSGPARPSIAPTTALRLVGLVLALAAFAVAFGLPRRFAQLVGWRLGSSAPVLFQRLLCAGLGVKVRPHGSIDARARQLIVANHVSWLDIPVLGSVAPMSFLAKKEIGNHPVGRELVALQGAVYVDRRRRSCIPRVNAAMAETMRSGSPVVLFAEATTGDGNRLLRFRSSHFEAVRIASRGDNEASVLIQPIYLDYSRLAGLPTGRLEKPRIAWYGDMTFLPHFLRYVRGGGVTCDVYFGQPIRITPEMHRKAAARETEAAVRRLAAEARIRRRGLFAATESA